MKKSIHNNLYYITNINEIDNKTIELMFEQLPPSRQEDANKCFYEVDRKIKIVEYCLIQQKLGLDKGQEFLYTKNGKPYLKSKQHFNISHSESALAVVFSDQNVGVDIQKKIDLDINLLSRIANKKEYQQVVNSDNPQLALTKLWTQKESLIKFKGKTIATNLKTLLRNKEIYDFKHFIEKDYVICVCSKKHI